jgi:hypothetical protein
MSRWQSNDARGAFVESASAVHEVERPGAQFGDVEREAQASFALTQ